MENEKPARFQFRLRTLPIVLVVLTFAGGAWFVLPRYVFQGTSHPRSSKIVGAKNIVNHLVISVENFKMDYNQYPWPDDAPPMATSMVDIIRELMPTDPEITKGKTSALNTAAESYLDGWLSDRVRDRYLKNGTLVDPWGNEYMIVYDERTKGPIIWSKGPNGIDETSDGDDIFNAAYKR